MTIFQKIAYWYFTKKALPYWGIVFLDCLAIVCSGCLVAILTDGPLSTILHWKPLALSMMAYVLCYMVGMRFQHTYDGILRYSSFVDLLRVGVANLIGLAFTFPVRVLLAHQGVAVLGYYDLVAVFFMATLLMWAFRITVKFFYEMEFKSKRSKRVFIYGTKNGGISLAKSIHGAEDRRYILAGFVSGDKKYLNKRLMGVRVVKDDLTLVEEMQLREGEKLYEELLNDMEITKPTHHPKIKIASVREYDYLEAKRNEEELHQISFSYDAMAVVKKMKQMVPEFKSQHSRYEVLNL